MVWLGAALCVALGALLAWVDWRRRHRRLLQLAARVPGPPALPLLGNALLFMAKPNEQLKLIGDIIAKYGEYVKFWLGPELNIVVTNPEDIKLLLTSNKVNRKGPVYEHLKYVIGPGILTGGEPWRNYRKIVTPSYNKKAVRAFSRVFNMEAASMADRLCARAGGPTFDVYRDVVHATTQCVCQTLMGLTKDESQSLANLDYVVFNTRRLYNFYFAKMTKWWLQIPFVFWLTGAKKTEETDLKEKFFILFKDIVDKRRKALARNEKSEDEARGVVDRLILSGSLNEQEIRSQVFTLFTTFYLLLQSQEAGAKIASAVLVYLAHLTEWQDKVYSEIEERLGTEDEFITEDQIKSLQYLDMVYKEVIRCMSIAALIQRTVEEEITINSGKITLPVGTSLAIPIHILHRSPKYWPDPDKVDPGRFLPENTKLRNPDAFVPYSWGPMDCLGRVYAVNMVKTLVVRALRRVRLEADGRLEDLSLDVAISVSFTHGYNLRTYPRRPKTNTPSAKAYCNDNLSITGGHKVSIRDVPFIASISEIEDEDEDKYEDVCAGSIIHERFILTAASCINEDKTKDRSVRVATETLIGDKSGAFIGVEKEFCHEHYDSEDLSNDICLLKLDTAIPFAWKIQVVLPDKDFGLEVGALVNATGWGATRRDGDKEMELRQVTLPVLPQKCCDEIYDGFNDDQICAGSRHRDFCQGDIGGPLTYNGVQVGIISGDGECGMNPGIYTRVTSYLDWIRSTINKNL